MCERKNDRNSGSRSFYGEHSLGACRYDDIDLAPNQFDCNLGGPLVASIRVSIIDRDGAAINPTKFTQPSHKTGHKIAHGGRRGRAKESNGGHLRRLLRAGRERPRRRRAAKQRDELAPSHSITSSARPSSGSGTVRPSALAVFILMVSWNFVTCWTGRSAGFSPLRMRPV